MALFGQYSTARFRGMDLLDLRPSLSLKAWVALVKQLRAGDTAGCEAAYRADRDVWIATVPAGHVDGVPRVAARGGWARIGDTRYPIIASVSASHTIVEIGPEKTVQKGESPPVSTGGRVLGPRTRARLPAPPSTTWSCTSIPRCRAGSSPERISPEAQSGPVGFPAAHPIARRSSPGMAVPAMAAPAMAGYAVIRPATRDGAHTVTSNPPSRLGIGSSTNGQQSRFGPPG